MPAKAAPSAKSTGSRRPGPAAEERRPRLPGRRLLLHFPRLSRAAAAQPQVGRAAGQCRARLLQHAVEADARHEAGGAADPSRGRVRQVGEDVPHRDVSGLQGAPAGSARRPASRSSRSSARRCAPSTCLAWSRRGFEADDLIATYVRAGLRGGRDRHHRRLRQGPDAARERLRRDVRHHEGQAGSASPR